MFITKGKKRCLVVLTHISSLYSPVWWKPGVILTAEQNIQFGRWVTLSQPAKSLLQTVRSVWTQPETQFNNSVLLRIHQI